MKSRFFIVVLAVFIIFSCDHFVNLGDKSADGADNTEGLPDEIYEGENSDSADTGNYDDWNEDSAADTDTYDEGENAPADTEGDYPGDNGDTDATDTTDSGTDYNDSDSNAPYPDEEWNDSSYVFPESDPFPAGFSNAECGCGDTPYYEPVCCNGMISVFNSCFANCYAVNSGNKICYYYETGVCGGAGIVMGMTEDDEGDTAPVDDEDDETDDDTELPDEDAEPTGIPNECGCYPENETAIFSCADNSFYFITECLARCHCENPQKLFF